MKKGQPLRILFVEDVPSDTELALRELQKAGIQAEHTRVETKETFLKALADFQPDLIISDYALPSFDGMQALKLALGNTGFLPFIILTGSMNEDTAVACMKAGATDYVIKEHMTRLPFAVKEALEQKSMQKKKEAAEQALRQNEKKYRSVFENIQDVYYETDFEGTILEVSPAIELLTGGQYMREDLIGKSMNDIYWDKKSGEELAAILQKNTWVWDYEIMLKNRNGAAIPCSLSSKIQLDEEGEPEKIIGTIRDNTQRKLAMSMLARRAQELAVTQEATISCMAILAEFRDTETGAHIQRAKYYVKLLSDKLGDKTPYSPDMLTLIWHSAPLHDIGKVAIPDSILLKPGKLTPEEWDLMKKHTLIGSDVIRRTEKILGETSFLHFAREIAEYHHEKWNGTGYPHGLAGEKIPLCARMMAVADVYDALVTSRPYKQPMPHEEAVKIIHNDSGTHFDPSLAKIFEEHHLEFDTIAKQYQE
jgi:PAS domain S-box-containing protein